MYFYKTKSVGYSQIILLLSRPVFTIPLGYLYRKHTHYIVWDLALLPCKESKNCDVGVAERRKYIIQNESID